MKATEMIDSIEKINRHYEEYCKMNVSEYGKTGSDDWLKAEELKGKTVSLIIESTEICTFGSDDEAEHKIGIKFKGRDKGIVSNRTNTKRLIEAFGDETDNWIGKKIIAAPNETNMGLGFSLTAMPDTDFNDDIPF